MSEVLYEVDDHGVAVITWNRPERRNMWTSAMEDAFYTALDRATADEAVRVIVVTGAGHTFCAGLDPQVLDDIRGGSAYTSNRRPQTYATTVPKMIIGAINGSCAGIGREIHHGVLPPGAARRGRVGVDADAARRPGPRYGPDGVGARLPQR